MKKIIVIGGSGFIGSSLVLYLSDFYKVTCLGRGENLQSMQLLVNENVRLVNNDEMAHKDYPALIEDSDIVIHLAGGGGNNYFIQHPDSIGRSLRLTDSVIQLCSRFKKKLVFSSSIAVYTTFTRRPNPLVESMRPLPDDVYGSLKLLNEYIIRNSKIDYVILRLANIYGNSFKFLSSGVIGRFIENASKGLPIDIFTDGSNKMDYLYLDDLNRSFKAVIEKDIANETVNIGSGSLFSLKEIASEVSSVFSEEYNKEVEVNILGTDSRVYADRLLSNEKANTVIEWSPAVSLKEGLKKTVRRYMGDSLNTPA